MTYVWNMEKACLPWKNDQPEDVIGQLVRVQPYYHIPTSGSSLKPVFSPWTVLAITDEKFGDDAVLVKWHHDGHKTAPWNALSRQYFHMRELHHYACKCPRCTSDKVWRP